MHAARSVFSARMLVAVCALVVITNVPTFGNVVTYPGPYNADAVDYTLVSESSFTDTAPLFGPPQIVGVETLRFESGMNFGAYASGANGVDVTDGRLYVKITAKENARISVVTLNELGGYVIAGAGGTSNTQVSASTLGLSVAVNAIDGVAVDGPVAIGTMKYNLITGNVSIPAEGDVPPGPGVTPVTFPIINNGSGTWHGYANFDMIGLLKGTQWEGHDITEATLTFDNLLVAQSEAGTVAYIDKKRVWITPEPGTLALLGVSGIALAGYFWCRRREAATPKI